MKSIVLSIISIFSLSLSIIAEDDSGMLLRWKFPEGTKYIYSSKTESKMDSTFDSEPLKENSEQKSNSFPMSSAFKVEGSCIISCKGDKALFTHIGKITEFEGESEKAKERRSKMPPDITTAVLSPDGKVTSNDLFTISGSKPIFNILFPIPEKALSKDEKVSQELMIPASGMPDLKGTAEYEYKAIKEVE